MSLVCVARQRRRTWLVILALGGYPLLGGPAHGQSPTEPAARAWSSEVLDALAAYQAGDYVGAQRLCGQIRSQPAAPRAQQDAAVLDALCLLRMPARADRTEGRARLRELAAEDPAVWDNPECDLAYGVAETALSETADALDALDRAAAGFAAQKLPAREAEALAALAAAWARHGEWERTPARLGVRRPLNATEAETTRRTQIATLRERIAALPDSTTALAQLDLVRAQHMLEAGEESAEGLAILTRLATAEPLTAAGATAAMCLAEQAESASDWSAALRWYERVRRAWHGDLAEQAARRAQELARPQIVVAGPASIACGQTLPVHLRVRGVGAVQLEVRRVDVEAWLSSGRARGDETTLPESGSLLVARELETPAALNGWWDSEQSGTPLEIAAPPGAYVLRVRGTSAEGQACTAKRLLVVSDLAAACFTGAREAVLWVTRQTSTISPDEDGPLTARFWMHRSFAATEVKFAGDSARFAWPNEARMMRDKGWVCLVRCREQLAICQGKLPEVAAPQTGSQVALLAGPPTPRVGEILYISGLLLPGEIGPLNLPTDQPVELQVLDALEQVQFRKTVLLSAGRAFTASMPITAELSGKHLHVLVRHGGQAVENVGERTTVSVPRIDTPAFRVHVEVPPWLAAETPELNGEIRAAYPWGTAPAQARVHGVIRALHLPTSAGNGESVLAPEIDFDARLDDTGRAPFSVPLADFGQSRTALALSVTADVDTWDGRRGTGSAQALAGAHPPHVWLTHEPAQPCAGQAVRFRVGWFDPRGLAVMSSPEVVLMRGDAELTRLPTHAAPQGLSTDPWRPAEAGSYDAVATLAVADGAPLQVRQRIEVGTAESSQPEVAPALHCIAQFTNAGGESAVRVGLEGDSPQPLLALLTSGEPRAAQSLPLLAGHADLLFPLAAEQASGLRVTVVRAAPSGFAVVCTEEVVPDPDEAVQVQVAATQADIWPGTTAPISVTCRSKANVAPGTTLTAWLVDAASANRILHPPRTRRIAPDAVIPGVTFAVSTKLSPALPTPVLDDPEMSGPAHEPADMLWRALSEGIPLWTVGVSAETNPTTLAVPLPAEPDLYKLIVMAHTPAGGIAAGATILDARRGVRLALEAPSRLTLGDRSLVAVRVENGYAEPVDAQLLCAGGDGLHLESLHLDTGGQANTGGPPDGATGLTLSPGGQAWLYFDVEAARVGRSQVSVTAAARGLEHSARSTYEVLPPDAPPGEPARTTIRRTLEAWTGPRNAEEAQDVDAHGNARWRWVPVSPDERILPGRFLRVTEDFVLSEPWPETTWSQRVPATCCPVTNNTDGGEALGLPQPTLPDALLFKMRRLGPGRYQHRFFVTAARPGACVLPAPQIRDGATPIPVVVQPAEQRLIVADSR